MIPFTNRNSSRNHPPKSWPRVPATFSQASRSQWSQGWCPKWHHTWWTESGVEQWGSGFGLETDAGECGRVWLFWGKTAKIDGSSSFPNLLWLCDMGILYFWQIHVEYGGSGIRNPVRVSQVPVQDQVNLTFNLNARPLVLRSFGQLKQQFPSGWSLKSWTEKFEPESP